MNQLMETYYPTFEMYQALRQQLLEILTDADLPFQPGGENLSLGALCRELGEVEAAYIESFMTFRQDFSYRHPDAKAMETSVARLTAWFQELDTRLKTAVAALSDEEVDHKMIERGPGFQLPPRIQLEVYKEALLIFYGKVTVYLRAMEKERPSQWDEWIG